MVIIGNFKMNKTASETKDFIKELEANIVANSDKISSDVEYAIAAPFVNIFAFQGSKIPVGAQNVSHHSQGAYTGEISVSMLKDLGVKYVILGHSERRQYHYESDSLINAKARKVIEAGMIPVVCVGETLDEYESGATNEVVLEQLESSLEDLDLSKIIIAYEPIWAIGTGKVATPEVANNVCKFIREKTAKDIVIQYGGSVNPSNVAELASQPDIDGFLVGGASLKPNDFTQLLTLGK